MLLQSFSVDDLIACSKAFHRLAEGVESMDEIAGRMTRWLWENLESENGPGCALVRLYKTHRYAGLPPDLATFARASASEPVVPATRCLTLLGSAGVEAAWNDTGTSAGHRAIPLTSEAIVEQSPMIAHLLRQFGMNISDVLRPDTAGMLGRHHQHYDIFFVPEAVDSPMVPAQPGFVEPYGVRSVVGCGGVLPSGDLFALILFTTVPLAPRTAELFRSLALSVKSAIIPFTFKVFADPRG